MPSNRHQHSLTSRQNQQSSSGALSASGASTEPGRGNPANARAARTITKLDGFVGAGLFGDCRPVGAEERAQLLRVELGLLERARNARRARARLRARRSPCARATPAAGGRCRRGRARSPDGTSTRRASCAGAIAAFAWYMRIEEPIVSREPVERHVREDLVLREAPLDVPVAVAPRPELLDDPRREPGGRVGEAEGRGLGLRAVHGGVGALGLRPRPRRPRARRAPLARGPPGRR